MAVSTTLPTTGVVVAFTIIALTSQHGVAQYPPAPGSGGAKCSIDAECGIPAANCQQLREKCASLSGQCKNGQCVCAEEYYGCSNCAAKATLVRNATDPNKFEYTTTHEMLDGTGRTINECSWEFPRGGKLCQVDLDCSGRGGLCLAGHCVCPDSWLCDDCSITLTDILYGLKCGMAKTGGGACENDSDCGSGQCVKTGAPHPFCACTALHTCEHCSATVQEVVTRQKRCPETLSLAIDSH